MFDWGKQVSEINEKSGAISREDIPEILEDKMIKKICEVCLLFRSI